MLVEVDSLSLYEVGAIAAAIVAAVIVSAKRMRSLRTRSACLPASLEGKVEAVFVAEAKIVDGAIFPLTLKPVVEDAQDPSAEHRLAFVRAHRDELLSLVRSRGAVLLRGWGPCSAEHFSEISTALNLAASEMSCSAGPRFEVAKNVFTANEAPPSERIPFHHEMAQCDNPPAVVMFFCELPAQVGGATPILQSFLAAEYLRKNHPAVAERLADKGVKYVRIMPPVTDPSSALGKSWRNSLRVETVEEAETSLRALGCTWTWLPNGMLHTVTKSMPALLLDERTGREIFFTAAETTFNSVEDEAIGATVEERDEALIRPVKAIIYGDGSPLDKPTKEALFDVSEFMVRSQVSIPWQQGDALLLNNATVQHSRETFTPPRRILASLVGQLSKAGHTLHERDPELGIKACGIATVSPSSTMDGLPITHA